MKKKILGIICIFLLAFACLAACGKESPSGGKEQGPVNPGNPGEVINPAEGKEDEDGSDIVENEQDRNERLLKEVKAMLQNISGWDNISYTYEIEVDDSIIVQHYAISGSKIKITMTNDDGTESYTYFDTSNGENIYYMPSEEKAYRSYNESDSLLNESPWAYMALIKDQTIVVAGQEKINGVDCTVVTYSDSNGDYTLWIDPYLALPVRVAFVNLDGTKSVTNFKDISTEELAGKDMTVPENVPIEDIDAL